MLLVVRDVEEPPAHALHGGEDVVPRRLKVHVHRVALEEPSAGVGDDAAADAAEEREDEAEEEESPDAVLDTVAVDTVALGTGKGGWKPRRVAAAIG